MSDPSSSSSSSSSLSLLDPDIVRSKSHDSGDYVDWEHRWDQKLTQWQKSVPHPDLVELLSHLPPSSRPPSSSSSSSRRSRILVPLCGKTLDLLYLFDAGYQVIGIELVPKAIVEFFSEHPKLAFTRTAVPNSQIQRYSTPDGLLTIFEANIFDEKLDADLIAAGGEGSGVDAIWDRGALVAVSRCERVKYVTKLISLLSPRSASSKGCDFLMNIFAYPQWIETGPPFAVTDSMFISIFESIASGVDRWKDEPNLVKAPNATIEEVYQSSLEERRIGGKFAIQVKKEGEEIRDSSVTGEKYTFKMRTYTVTRI